MSHHEWDLAAPLVPGSYTDDPENRDAKLATIILNQPLDNLDMLRRVWANSVLHVAADGGANRLYQVAGAHGNKDFDHLDAIIGDLDSLRDDARAHFANARVIHDPDQYSTDFTKAVKYVRGKLSSPLDIVALGGLGGRVDQGLSQLHHLLLFQQDYAAGKMFLVSDESVTIVLLPGAHTLKVGRVAKDGDGLFDKYVGIIPLREPATITTQGLEWDVTDWHTAMGDIISTSNHVLPESEVVRISTSKAVIFTIALRKSE